MDSRLCVNAGRRDVRCLRFTRALARAALAAGLWMAVENARAALEVAAHLRAAGRTAKDMLCGGLQQSRKQAARRAVSARYLAARAPGKRSDT